MLNQLLNKKVIYAVYHTKEIKTGWCESIENIWSDGRLWPNIVDDETKVTFAVFGPVVPYSKDVMEKVRELEVQDEGFVKCWDFLYSMDHNKEGD